MELSPPRYPSAKNVGLVVRMRKNDQYVFRDRDTDSEATVVDIIIIGLSAGVRTLLSNHTQHARACAMMDLCRARMPDPSRSRVQIILKKGAKKPYTKSSFTFKFLYVVTSRSHLSQIWYQEFKMTSKESKGVLAQIDPHEFPEPALMLKDSLIELFLARFAAKEVGPEFIGRNGIPGMAWPSLDAHDANHTFLLGKPRA